MSELPVAPFSRILKDAGATRSTDEAKKVFVQAVEEQARKIARNSVFFAHHNKRKTVTVADIQFAVDRIK